MHQTFTTSADRRAFCLILYSACMMINPAVCVCVRACAFVCVVTAHTEFQLRYLYRCCSWISARSPCGHAADWLTRLVSFHCLLWRVKSRSCWELFLRCIIFVTLAHAAPHHRQRCINAQLFSRLLVQEHTINDSLTQENTCNNPHTQSYTALPTKYGRLCYYLA